MLDKLRILAGSSILLTILAISWQWHRAYAQEIMRISDLPNYGLTLLSSQDHDFERLLTTVLGNETTPETDSLKPYTVVLRNNSTKTLVAYSLRWEYTNPEGRRIHVDYSDGEITRLLDGATRKPTTEYSKAGPTLEPHSFVIVTPSMALKTNSGSRERASDPAYKNVLQRLNSRFSQGRDISVTVDGAVFEDGTFVGQNATHLFEKFGAELRAEQKLIEEVVLAAQQNRNMGDVVREIQASLPSSPPQLYFAPDGELSGYDEYYRYQYTSRFVSIYRNSGEKSALEWAQSNLFRNTPKLISLGAKE